MIREHHDRIVECLWKAVRFGDIPVDQQVKGMNSECRPDLIITNGNNVIVIDVTCPFENGQGALAAADFA